VAKLTHLPYGCAPTSPDHLDRLRSQSEPIHFAGRNLERRKSMSENAIWMATVNVILLLSIYGFASIAFAPWV
jgi:hypothetical protein